MDKREILELFSFYREASLKERRQILQATNLKRLSAGNLIQLEGDSCREFYWVGAGNTRVYKSNNKGKEITLYHVSRGESCVLSATSILSDRTFPATAAVQKTVQAVIISPVDFKQLVLDAPSFRKFVYNLIGSGIADILALLHGLAFLKIETRLAQFLWRQFDNKGLPVPVVTFTHDQIAAELDYAREVISRMLKELEKKQIIKLSRGHIRVVDANELRRMALTSV